MTAVAGICGIYDSQPDAWTRDAIHIVRCGVCQHDWHHYRPESAVALYLAHLEDAES